MSVELPKLPPVLPLTTHRSENNKRHPLLESTSQKCVAAFLTLRDMQSLGLTCFGQPERMFGHRSVPTTEHPVGTAILPSVVAGRYTLDHPITAHDFLFYSHIYDSRPFPEIRSLTFFGIPALLAKLPEILTKLPNLRNISLEGADSVTHEYLVLANTSSTFEFFKMITKDFEISECLNQNPCILLKDRNLSALKNHDLVSFELRHCILFTGIGLHYLKKTHLETLKFERCNFQDVGMQMLTQLPLRTLKLAFCPAITSAGWALLPNLSLLEHLDLTGCDQLTDDDLLPIAQLPNLKTLNLSHCSKITDCGLQSLERCKLTSLNLMGCSNISQDAFASYHTAETASIISSYAGRDENR